MRVVMVLARCLTVGILAVPTIDAADEPFWNSRPLGYWLNQLRVGDAAARMQAARGVGEIAAAHGGAVVAAALPLLCPVWIRQRLRSGLLPPTRSVRSAPRPTARARAY